MSTTIVVRNRKGGVGKTTIAVHLAAFLSMQRFRVGLIDTDAQGNAALALGLPRMDGLFEVMAGDNATLLEDVVLRADPERYALPDRDTGELLVLPSANRTVAIPTINQDVFAFSDVIVEMVELYALDFVIVDTGPTASMFDGSVYIAADHILYVTECARMSFEGLSQSLAEMDQIIENYHRRMGKQIDIVGVVPNQLDFRTKNHRENYDLLKEEFPELMYRPIRRLTNFELAMEYGQTVFSLVPGEREVTEMSAMGMSVLKALGVAYAPA